jgi:hypothetical protein
VVIGVVFGSDIMECVEKIDISNLMYDMDIFMTAVAGVLI